ncbi:MAG: phosphatidylserine decarboxylase [Parachlamydiales bacterium]
MLKLPPIEVIDRQTGDRFVEAVYGEAAIAFLYGRGRLLHPLLHNPLFSVLYGKVQGSRLSRHKVLPFIKKYGLDTTEFETEPADFRSFNDFFIRKLKAGARRIADSAAVLPADGRYLFFPKIEEEHTFFAKGQRFSLKEFLRSSRLAAQYEGGAMVIGRLCPTDYHRFHFPADGIPSESSLINGWLASVNPAAIRDNMKIFWENRRSLTPLQTPHLGRILIVEVGALCVGKIHQTYVANKRVKRGDEKGYFSFGGSSVVLLFEPGRITFDPDLVAASGEGLEVMCLMGQSLGKSASPQ